MRYIKFTSLSTNSSNLHPLNAKAKEPVGFDNMFNKIILGLTILAFSSLSFSMSKQYRGGEVSIMIKNNEPCFYIENLDLFGNYYINLFEEKDIKNIGGYTSNFQKKYPQKSSCISSSVISHHVFQENKPYLVVIETDTGLSFGKSFCVSEKQGIKEIQDFALRCEYQKESFVQKLYKFFGLD